MMNKYMKLLVYSALLLSLSGMLFAGCGKPEVNVDSVSGFTHEVSVRIPFDPQNDTVTSLRIDDEGNTALIMRDEILHGKVNPEKEYRLETYRISKGGSKETGEYGPFEAVRISREGSFIITADETDMVTWLDSDTLDITRIENEGLSLALKASIGDYFDSEIMTHTVPLSSKLGVERWLAIQNMNTTKGVLVDFQEEYVNIDAIDSRDEMLQIEAGRGIGNPVTLYVLSLDGTDMTDLDIDQQFSGGRTIEDFEHVQVEIRDRLLSARLTGDGLVVLLDDSLAVETDQDTSETNIGRGYALKKYSLQGKEEWHRALPVQGVAHLSLLDEEAGEIIAVTLADNNDLTGFIGYYHADSGDEIYSRTVDVTETYEGLISVHALDEPGLYYIRPEPSSYPGIPSYGGKVSLYSYDKVIASADFEEPIYHFAVSPDDKFFAVITDGTLSIFSIDRDAN
jgi:hypothetical protein